MENMYEDGIDFAALAQSDGDFAKMYQNGQLDLQDPRALQYISDQAWKC